MSNSNTLTLEINQDFDGGIMVGIGAMKAVLNRRFHKNEITEAWLSEVFDEAMAELDRSLAAAVYV